MEISLIRENSAVPILIEECAYEGVRRIGETVASDIEMVTGFRPSVITEKELEAGGGPDVVIFCAVAGKSPLLSLLTGERASGQHGPEEPVCREQRETVGQLGLEEPVRREQRETVGQHGSEEPACREQRETVGQHGSEEPVCREQRETVGQHGSEEPVCREQEEVSTRCGSVDLSRLEGKREVYQIFFAESPFFGVKKALVICGSDKRGTIYGMFALSEYLGVTPLVYWGDSAPQRWENPVIREDICVLSREPSVRYRGFFINDEWPCFGTWVTEHFGGFNAKAYQYVFEFLLRMKGNYLWPAMWTASFPLDGPGGANEELADIYGVVMGYSHHEPCLRASEEWDKVRGEQSPYGNEWNFYKNEQGLLRYWEDALKRSGRYENVITIGMRGERDSSMLGEDATVAENVALLKDIIYKQRQLIRRYVREDVSEVPQMLALYKEVEEYFYGDETVAGLKDWEELDGVICMLCEDNFGHMRTLPTEEIRNRRGGFGMYYHFDYHGGPVSYEWIDSTPLTKTWEQMCMAYEYGIRELWIVNAGDVKFHEVPLTYFMNLAYDYEKWGVNNPHSAEEYAKKWAADNFGPSRQSEILKDSEEKKDPQPESLCETGESCGFGKDNKTGESCGFGKDNKTGESCGFGKDSKTGESCGLGKDSKTGESCGLGKDSKTGESCGLRKDSKTGENCGLGKDSNTGESCGLGKDSKISENCGPEKGSETGEKSGQEKSPRVTETEALQQELQRKTAAVFMEYIHLLSLRRPEALNDKTCHPCRYLEADRILERVLAVEEASDDIFNRLDERGKRGYYSMIHYPLMAGMNLMKLHLYAGKNHHYAGQGRAIANLYGRLAEECMIRDRKLAEEFAQFQGGKWNGMQKAPHIGFTKWNEDGCRYPVICRVTPVPAPRLSVSRKDEERVCCRNYGTPEVVRIDDFMSAGCNRVLLELANDGEGTLCCRIVPETGVLPDWLEIAAVPDAARKGEETAIVLEGGTSRSLREVEIRCLRQKLPRGISGQRLLVTDGDTTVAVEISAQRIETKGLSPMTFLPKNGVVVMDAKHYAEKKDAGEAGFRVLENYGKYESAVKVFPVTASFPESEAVRPRLIYRFMLEQKGTYRVELVAAPTNSPVQGKALRFQISVEGVGVKEAELIGGDFRAGDHRDDSWCRGVLDQSRTVSVLFEMEAGLQKLTVGAMEAGAVLERIRIYPVDRPLPESCFGPEESFCFCGRESC